MYTIIKVMEDEHNCPMRCNRCNVCAHMYKCDCKDYLIAKTHCCKHIHCVYIREYGKQTQQIKELPAQEDLDILTYQVTADSSSQTRD